MIDFVSTKIQGDVSFKYGFFRVVVNYAAADVNFPSGGKGTDQLGSAALQQGVSKANTRLMVL